MKITLTLVAALWVGAIYAADLLTLNNQMVFEGKVLKIKNCSVVFKTDGNKYLIPADEIYCIQFEDKNDKVYTRYMENADNDKSGCLHGKSDASKYHGKKGGHFVLGVLFGPFAVAGTLLSNPTPEKGKLTLQMSKNKEEFNNPEYLSCYKKEAKAQLLGIEAIGMGAWLLLLLML